MKYKIVNDMFLNITNEKAEAPAKYLNKTSKDLCDY